MVKVCSVSNAIELSVPVLYRVSGIVNVHHNSNSGVLFFHLTMNPTIHTSQYHCQYILLNQSNTSFRYHPSPPDSMHSPNSGPRSIDTAVGSVLGFTERLPAIGKLSCISISKTRLILQYR